MGALSQKQMLEHYCAADLFVLAGRVAKDGDRDGLPNVLMEAQSRGLACVSTRVSAVPELIADDATCALVAPGDENALAEKLDALIADPAGRGELDAAGAKRVRKAFSCAAGIAALATRFGVKSPVPDDRVAAGTGASEKRKEVRAAGL